LGATGYTNSGPGESKKVPRHEKQGPVQRKKKLKSKEKKGKIPWGKGCVLKNNQSTVGKRGQLLGKKKSFLAMRELGQAEVQSLDKGGERTKALGF